VGEWQVAGQMLAGLAKQAGSSRVVPDDALLAVKQQQTVWG
jgi:hypothetical protein